ncbi:hypothetical protein HK099_003139 [Clydaea vesicula]|uniref:Uncharacterized protein n=1 Tax=Clydaea vesicula TaxID=447962 RepID=A0AAD5U784_9FUNG|nr:hypothetical protein HK099_003139 [Clydaea vesicula]
MFLLNNEKKLKDGTYYKEINIGFETNIRSKFLEAPKAKFLGTLEERRNELEECKKFYKRNLHLFDGNERVKITQNFHFLQKYAVEHNYSIEKSSVKSFWLDALLVNHKANKLLFKKFYLDTEEQWEEEEEIDVVKPPNCKFNGTKEVVESELEICKNFLKKYPTFFENKDINRILHNFYIIQRFILQEDYKIENSSKKSVFTHCLSPNADVAVKKLVFKDSFDEKKDVLHRRKMRFENIDEDSKKTLIALEKEKNALKKNGNFNKIEQEIYFEKIKSLLDPASDLTRQKKLRAYIRSVAHRSVLDKLWTKKPPPNVSVGFFLRLAVDGVVYGKDARKSLSIGEIEKLFQILESKEETLDGFFSKKNLNFSKEINDNQFFALRKFSNECFDVETQITVRECLAKAVETR